MRTLLFSIGVAVVLFELVEHLVLPLIFYNRVRKKNPLVGRRALPGKTARVVSWQGQGGTVRLAGEYWQARSRQPLSKNRKVRVVAVENLVLVVEAVDETARP